MVVIDMRIRHLFITTAIVAACGCSTVTPKDLRVPEEAYLMEHKPKVSQPPSFISTPYSDVLSCLGVEAETGVSGTNFMNQFRYSISVGMIADLTGKQNFNTSIGSPVSNAAQNMMTSALMDSKGYRVVNRTFTAISDSERALTSQKLIKDHDQHDAQRLRNIAAGEITGSEWHIYGSVSSFDYGLASGGGEAMITGTGVKQRYFASNVSVDLFLVNTRSTVIVHSVSLHKQLVGQETEVGLFRFDWLPDNEFIDLSTGSKESELAGLALRMIVQKAAYEFTGYLYGWSNIPVKCKALYALANAKIKGN